MEIPPGRFDQLLKAVLFPTAFLEALEKQVIPVSGFPRPLWRLMVILSVLGAFVFGFSAGLVIGPWPAVTTGLILLAALVCGWLAALPLLVLGGEGPPCWQRFHGATVSMITGELIFECGMVLNGLFWVFDWLTDAQGLAFNLLWIGLADVAMLVMLISLWHSHRTIALKPLAIWIGVFHPVAIGTAILLGRMAKLSWPLT